MSWPTMPLAVSECTFVWRTGIRYRHCVFSKLPLVLIPWPSSGAKPKLPSDSCQPNGGNGRPAHWHRILPELAPQPNQQRSKRRRTFGLACATSRFPGVGAGGTANPVAIQGSPMPPRPLEGENPGCSLPIYRRQTVRLFTHS